MAEEYWHKNVQVIGKRDEKVKKIRTAENYLQFPLCDFIL